MSSKDYDFMSRPEKHTDNDAAHKTHKALGCRPQADGNISRGQEQQKENAVSNIKYEVVSGNACKTTHRWYIPASGAPKANPGSQQ
jgi:hypothetical protein